MSEEERSNLYIYVYSALDDDLIFAETKYTLADLHKLQRENQELKKQLENCYCNRTDCSSRIKDSKKYDSLVQKVENQQKEFIECLENEIEALEFCDNEFILSNHKKEVKAYKEILLKYKEIIGKDINVSTK